MTAQIIRGEEPKSRLGKFVRGAKDRVREAIGRHAPYLARRVTNFHHLEDRVFMELVILPFFRDSPDMRDVLFVGTEWYTKPYEQFFRDKNYWTLEIDPDRARYGSRKHIVAPMGEIEAHLPPASLDAILCNGVFYRGAMDQREEAERSFRSCWRTLRPGGWFVLGWNDRPDLRPYPPAESEALGEFERAPFPPIGADEHRTGTENRHTFTFYRRPE